MVVPAIIGLVLLVIIIYVAFKVLKNLVFGLVLIGIVIFASFLIFGSLPDLRALPLIGKYLPELPSTTGEVIGIVKNVFYNIDILSVSRDSQNNLLINVANTGRMSVSGFQVFVDGMLVNIVNDPKDPLDSKEVTTIQTDWKGDFTKVTVNTNQVSATYP